MSNGTKNPLVRLAGVGGAIITGVVLVALCLIPFPRLFLSPVSLTINPTSTAPTKICPGGFVDVVGSSGDATTFRAFAAPSIAVMSNGQPPTQSSLGVQDDVATDSSFFPQILTGQSSTDATKPNLIAGTQSQVAKSDVISGLASSVCGEGSTDQWLVGGSTEVGRTTLLFLNNPLDVEAVVGLDIYGENGKVDAPGTANIIVKPRSQRILSLAAFAPNLVQPVVHVTTSGGQVFATMQQTVTRVVTPSGIDFVSPGAPAATMQVIPGVALSGQSGQDGEGGQVTSDLAPTIRVLIPGAKGAQVTATIINTNGESTVVKTQLSSQHVVQLPFSGVPDGIYTVVVTANVPLLAGARTVQGAGVPIAPVSNANPAPSSAPTAAAAPPQVGGDFTWNASTVRIGDSTLVPIPIGANPVLTLFNSGAESAHVTLQAQGQHWQDVDVPAGASRSIAIGGVQELTISQATTIHAAVTQRDIGLGTSFPVSPASRLGSAITVFPN